MRVVNDDNVGDFDQDEKDDEKESTSLYFSYAGTVLRKDIQAGDQNWAQYVHGSGDEFVDGIHNEDTSIQVHDFARQSGRLPQIDGHYSDEEADRTDDDKTVKHETHLESCEDVLGGCVILGNDLVHFDRHDCKIGNLQEGDGSFSDQENGSSEEDIQLGVQNKNSESQTYGHPGHSGHWLRTSQSLRRFPKKENFHESLHDPINGAHGQSESGDICLQDEEPYFESEVKLGDTQLLELEDQNQSEEWVTFDGHTHDPGQDSLDGEQQQERQPEINSQAAIDAYHCAVKIKMSNGEQWVFDPTAAQFGYSHPLLPLTQYLIRMKSAPISVSNHPIGTAKSNIEESVAWKHLRKLGRVVTDGTEIGEQEVRRRFQWGQMDEIIEEALSKVLGLQKELEKEKAKAENNGKSIKKKASIVNNKAATNRLSTIKMPTLKNRASKLIHTANNRPGKEGPDVGHKRLMRAPNSEFDILLSATLTQLVTLVSLGRDTLYTPSSRDSRDTRVKYWDLFRSFHERFPTPECPPQRPHKEVKKEYKAAIKEIDRKEKESRKKIKKEIRDMRRESRRVVREHEKKRKELLKRVEKVMRRWEVEEMRREVVVNSAPQNDASDDIDQGFLENPEGLKNADGEFEYEYGALAEGEDVEEHFDGEEELALEAEEHRLYEGMTELELRKLEDFAEHLEWVERNEMAGRMDILTSPRTREVIHAG